MKSWLSQFCYLDKKTSIWKTYCENEVAKKGITNNNNEHQKESEKIRDKLGQKEIFLDKLQKRRLIVWTRF
jgi:hypothetical protein